MASGRSQGRRYGGRSRNRIGGANGITHGQSSTQGARGAEKSERDRPRQRRVAGCERGSRRAGSGGEESRDFRVAGWYGPVRRICGSATALWRSKDRQCSSRGGGTVGGCAGGPESADRWRPQPRGG